jgi:lysophospholipase L1-like esterase
MKFKLILLASLLLSPPIALHAAETPSAKSSTRLACIGDSITAGYVANPRTTMSYPSQVGRMLGTNWTVGNFGVSSSTLMDTPASKRVWRISAMAKVVTFAPDVVIINLGINDCNPEVWTNKADFLPTYRALLKDLRALPSKPKILVCRPTHLTTRSLMPRGGWVSKNSSPCWICSRRKNTCNSWTSTGR